MVVIVPLGWNRRPMVLIAPPGGTTNSTIIAKARDRALRGFSGSGCHEGRSFFESPRGYVCKIAGA